MSKRKGYNSNKHNSGKHNSGNYNSGNYNSGHWNSGHWNSGHWNSGYWNSGDNNTGCNNLGRWNSGDNNLGASNSGDWNLGHWNSGDWNSCDYETGYFNTKQSKYIRVFNKKCLRRKWDKARKPSFIYFSLVKWVSCTKEEMGKNKNKKLTTGYLRTFDYKEAFKESFNKASKRDIKLLLKLPNFNYKVFEEISGISKRMIKEKLKEVM